MYVCVVVRSFEEKKNVIPNSRHIFKQTKRTLGYNFVVVNTHIRDKHVDMNQNIYIHIRYICKFIYIHTYVVSVNLYIY